MNEASKGPHKKRASGFGDDPKRDYFEKMGARFASGFLAGTGVGDVDEVDVYECL